MRIGIIILLVVMKTTTLISQNENLKKFGIIDNDVPKGLQVGEKAPLFNGVDKDGNAFSLKTQLKKGSVVVIFYRGYWCPVCSKYLKNYVDSANLVTQKGASLLFVTPESKEGVEKTVKKNKLNYTVVLDKDERIMKAFDVDFEVTNGYQKKIKTFLFTDIAKNNNKETAKLPVPATFIIDKSGTIVYRQFDLNYKNRASIKEIVENLP